MAELFNVVLRGTIHHFRRGVPDDLSEQTALADPGLRACVVRNPRSVHGVGETHGFVPMPFAPPVTRLSRRSAPAIAAGRREA